MRAAANRVFSRARSWQSQRVTRLSFEALPLPELACTPFHPVPAQSGQTSVGALIATGSFVRLAIWSTSTVHPRAGFAQAGKAGGLCTSCVGSGQVVDGVGKPSRCVLNAAPVGPIRGEEVRNRLPVRIFTVDIRRRGRRIPPVRFSNSAIASFYPGAGWARKKPARRDS